MPIHKRYGKLYYRCAQSHRHVWQCWAFDASHWLRTRYDRHAIISKLNAWQIVYLTYTLGVLVALLAYFLVWWLT